MVHRIGFQWNGCNGQFATWNTCKHHSVIRTRLSAKVSHMIKESVMNANQVFWIALPTVATIRPAFRIAIVTLLIVWMAVIDFVNK